MGTHRARRDRRTEPCLPVRVTVTQADGPLFVEHFPAIVQSASGQTRSSRQRQEERQRDIVVWFNHLFSILPIRTFTRSWLVE